MPAGRPRGPPPLGARAPRPPRGARQAAARPPQPAAKRSPAGGRLRGHARARRTPRGPGECPSGPAAAWAPARLPHRRGRASCPQAAGARFRHDLPGTDGSALPVLELSHLPLLNWSLCPATTSSLNLRGGLPGCQETCQPRSRTSLCRLSRCPCCLSEAFGTESFLKTFENNLFLNVPCCPRRRMEALLLYTSAGAEKTVSTSKRCQTSVKYPVPPSCMLERDLTLC